MPTLSRQLCEVIENPASWHATCIRIGIQEQFRGQGMLNFTTTEQNRLSEEIDTLDEKLSKTGPVEGLKARCANSFLKQLRRHKRDRLATLKTESERPVS